MSPELQTLDDLLGGDIPLDRVRQIFGDDEKARHSLVAMLHDGEIALLSDDFNVIPHWEWRQVLTEASSSVLVHLMPFGARRIGY